MFVDVNELPASEIPKITRIKSGLLTYQRKTDRWFFRREHYVKVFGAVFEEHFLIYKNEKSDKPLLCLNLSTFKGKEVVNSKKRGAFEISDKIQTYNVIYF